MKTVALGAPVAFAGQGRVGDMFASRHVVADPHERDDLTYDPAYAEKRAELTAIWLDAWENEYWVPTFPFDTLSTGAPDAAHADRAIHANGGYVTHWGCEANLRDR